MCVCVLENSLPIHFQQHLTIICIRFYFVLSHSFSKQQNLPKLSSSISKWQFVVWFWIFIYTFIFVTCHAQHNQLWLLFILTHRYCWMVLHLLVVTWAHNICICYDDEIVIELSVNCLSVFWNGFELLHWTFPLWGKINKRTHVQRPYNCNT